MGVAVSERVRTFRGELFRLDDHLKRLERSLAMIGLEKAATAYRLADAAVELVRRTRGPLDDRDDVGLALFVTPGVAGVDRPTVAMQCYPLPFHHWADFYDRGQMLAETPVRQVPAECWPAQLKCRSRLHYYLADQMASQQWPGARAILVDQLGCVTEASTANVLICDRQGEVVSPRKESILSGVSLAVVHQLCQIEGIPFSDRDVGLEELARADEVWLCSTSPCLWPATSFNGQPIGSGRPGPVWQQLINAWDRLVGVDVVKQARQFRNR